MTKENKVKFTCDNCEKENEVSVKEGIGVFPYSDGWQFLYNLNLKLKGVKKELLDRHFCSDECLTNYITQWIKK